MSEKPTLKSVAELAGVATATVGRVLHNNGYVSEASRKRVLKAVAESGYRINSIASSLKRNRSNVLGLLIQSSTPNPFFAKVEMGVEHYAQQQGYTTLTFNVQQGAESELRGVETFLSWRADAIIFATPISGTNVDFAVQANIPVVQVERPKSDQSDYITVNNYLGASAAMDHLLELGHQKVAYVGHELRSQNNRLADYVEEERFGAYRDKLRERNLFDDSRVAFGRAYSTLDSESRGKGYHSMKQWLASDNIPTALLASSDLLAAGALQAIYEYGLHVPKDISIIGFDDTLAPYLTPRLTTVRLPSQQLGKAAAKMAIQRLDGGVSGKPRATVLDTELIVRQSTHSRN